MSSQWGSQKLLHGLVSHKFTAYPYISNLFKLLWIMAVLSKACKPDNFESRNSLKLSFTNIWDLCSNFDDCKSFLESNSPDILALSETNLHDSIESSSFSVRDYWKGSSTHMHDLTLCMKEELPFARDLFLENSVDSYLCFQLTLLQSVCYFFSSIDHLLRLWALFLILFHLT